MPLLVKDLMTTDVRTVAPDLPLSDFQELLLRHRISGAPVVEGERLVGIISRSDVVRQLAVEEQRIESSSFFLEPFDADEMSEAEQEQPIRAAAQRLATLHVRDMMVREVVTIGPDATLEELARLIVDRHIRRVLVTDGEQVVGLVSTLDLVRLFADGRAKA